MTQTSGGIQESFLVSKTYVRLGVLRTRVCLIALALSIGFFRFPKRRGSNERERSQRDSWQGLQEENALVGAPNLVGGVVDAAVSAIVGIG